MRAVPCQLGPMTAIAKITHPQPVLLGIGRVLKTNKETKPSLFHITFIRPATDSEYRRGFISSGYCNSLRVLQPTRGNSQHAGDDLQDPGPSPPPRAQTRLLSNPGHCQVLKAPDTLDYMCICMYTYTYIHTCVDMQIYTYTHI